MYGTSTVIVWPRMFSAGLSPAAPLVPDAAASTTSTAPAATAVTRRCNLFMCPPCARLCELTQGAGSVPARSSTADRDTTRALEGIQRPGSGAHPLDPLTAAELAASPRRCAATTAFASLGERTRFVTIALREPAKDAVLAWDAGGAAPRREAEVVILDRGRREHDRGSSSSLDPDEVTAWRARTDIQPMAVVSELMEAEELVRLDPAVPGGDGPAWHQRLRRRPGGRLAGRALRPGRGRRAAARAARSRSSSRSPATTNGPTPSTA